MTKRELYTAVIENAVTDEVVEGFKALIEGLDHTNDLRKVSAAKKAAEKEAVKAPIREAIVAVITDEPKTATTLIAEAGVEIKPRHAGRQVGQLLDRPRETVGVDPRGQHRGS